MFPTLSLGPLNVQTPGLILIISLYGGLWLAEKKAPRFSLSPDLPYNLTTLLVVSGLVGGRVVYALQYLDVFLQAPGSLFSLNPGLMSWPGALLTAGVAFLGYTQKKALPVWRVLDALTPALAVTTVGVALSWLAAGKFFGTPTTLPWAITLWGSPRHPTQIYALLAASGTLVYILRQMQTPPAQEGMVFLQFGALTASWFLFISGLRGDSNLLPGGFRQEQVIAWLLLALFLYLAEKRRSDG